MVSPAGVLWFLSHRQHYDPRIYTILSAFRASGWTTVLFDPPPDQGQALEWTDVIPLSWSPVPPAELRETPAATAPSAVQVFLETLTQEDLATDQVSIKDTIRFTVFHGAAGTLVSFQETDGDMRYVWNPHTQTLWSALAAQTPAEAVALSLHNRLVRGEAVEEALADLEDYTVTETDQDYHLHPINRADDRAEYLIDRQTGLVRTRRLTLRDLEPADLAIRQTLDFSEFTAEIYNYAIELDLVQKAVDDPLRPPPDAVFVSDLPTLPIGIMLKSVFGCKLIIDCHEWWAEQERIWHPEAHAKIAVIDRWERSLYAHCDAALTVSQTLAKEMEAHFGKPFLYVPTCVFDLPNLPERDPQFWQASADLPEGASVALFQGGLSTNRNLDTLMRASAQLDDNQYIVVCGDGPYRAGMEAVLANEGRPDRVRFLGWCPQLDLWTYTLNADLGVIPYTHFLRYYQLSAPNKLSEYHSCQLPILADKQMIELSHVITQDGVGHVADLSDPVTLGTSIRDLLKDRSRLETFRLNYRKAAPRFTRKSIATYLKPLIEMM